MLIWLEPHSHQHQLIELFSGQGNVSDVWRRLGRSVASFDRVLGLPMDLQTPSGLAPGPCKLIRIPFGDSLAYAIGLRLALWLVMSAGPVRACHLS